MTVAQRQVRLHGQHIAYLEAGAGRDPVVVLLHGLASRSATWADVMPLVGRRAHDTPAEGVPHDGGPLQVEDGEQVA